MTNLITPFRGKTPVVHPDAFVDPSARVIGHVTIEEGASVWPMAILRADSASIRVGRRSAILDLCLLEAPTDHPVMIGDGALISHGAVVHGARIEGLALVGIGAIILDGSVVSSGCIVAAGSVVSPGTTIPPNSLVVGVPGRVARETTQKERDSVLNQINELYTKSRHYKQI